jgi:hypothetical protein
MLDNRKLLYAVTALAIIGVLSLLAYSVSLDAIEIGIGDIQRSHEGSVILTSGIVTEARTFSEGSVSLVLSDMNTSASVGVFISPEVAVAIGNGTLLPGTELSVRGVISFYLEKPEITISSATDIIVLAEPGIREYELGTVMNAIDLFEGIETITIGQITDMKVISSSGNLVGTSFRLKGVTDNRTYYLECFCYDRDLTLTNSEWETVRIAGTISYYQSQGCWQMSVEIINPA